MGAGALIPLLNVENCAMLSFYEPFLIILFSEIACSD